MELDEKLLIDIIKIQNTEPLNFVLFIDDKSIPLSNVKISKSSTPLTKPNTRGGVYHSEPLIYKIQGETSDLSSLPFLSNSMLGPNTEFKELEIKTNLSQDDQSKQVFLLTNLTNTMQSSNRIQLFMNIVGARLIN